MEENVAFRYLAAGSFPNHRTLCRFRERHLEAFGEVFGQVVQLAQASGLVKMGTLAIDGTKTKADASKHKGMSYERMHEEEPPRTEQGAGRMEPPDSGPQPSTDESNGPMGMRGEKGGSPFIKRERLQAETARSESEGSVAKILPEYSGT